MKLRRHFIERTKPSPEWIIEDLLRSQPFSKRVSFSPIPITYLYTDKRWVHLLQSWFDLNKFIRNGNLKNYYQVFIMGCVLKRGASTLLPCSTMKKTLSFPLESFSNFLRKMCLKSSLAYQKVSVLATYLPVWVFRLGLQMNWTQCVSNHDQLTVCYCGVRSPGADQPNEWDRGRCAWCCFLRCTTRWWQHVHPQNNWRHIHRTSRYWSGWRKWRVRGTCGCCCRDGRRCRWLLRGFLGGIDIKCIIFDFACFQNGCLSTCVFYWSSLLVFL